MSKRTAGILNDIELVFGPELLDEIWKNVQFGRSSGITCVKVIGVQFPFKNVTGLTYLAEESAGISTMSRKCVICEENHEIELDLTMKELREAWARWHNGELIQACFPDTLLEDREFMMSSICPQCFDKAFGSDD